MLAEILSEEVTLFAKQSKNNAANNKQKQQVAMTPTHTEHIAGWKRDDSFENRSSQDQQNRRSDRDM